MYEAVTAKRPYKKPFSPERAASMLLEEAGTAFNPLCVEAFLSCFGVYPVGCRVWLEDGCEAQVVSTSPSDPFRPRVLVTHDPAGQPVVNGGMIDTAERDSVNAYVHPIVRSAPPAERIAEELPDGVD